VTYLIIAFFFGLAGAWVARAKGNSMIVWFLIAAIVPVAGLLAAVLYRSEEEEPRRLCPTCGKVCMLHDALCTRCGTELEWTDEVLRPPAATV
jgi:peptidoglycan/LPS O-acetylase OafA/YrhL